MLTYQQLVTNALKTIKEITVSELMELTAKTSAVVIDVRESDEIEKGVIPNSYWVSRGVLEFQIASIVEQQKWNYNNEIYICCRSGNRSALAALALLEMGFKKPISVAGGFNAWDEAGYTVAQKPQAFIN